MDPILVLQYATPVGLAALGETIGQKAGVLNIGIEGAMLAAAYSGAMCSLSTGSPWLGMLAGLITGLAAALLLAFFCLKLACDQVVVGTALNLLALGGTGALFRARFGESGRLLSVPTLPRFHGVDAVMLLGIALAFATTWLLNRSAWGLAVRGAGECPKAVQSSGFSVGLVRLQSLLVGGALAGLGGAYLSLGVVGSFTENMTYGRGFVAIAMVTFGQWKPVYVFLAAILIGYAESLQYLLQARNVQVPYQLLIALPYVLALVVLVFAGRGANSPAALGQPFRSER